MYHKLRNCYQIYLYPSHSTLNRVKCEKQILPSVGFEPTTCCIRDR